DGAALREVISRRFHFERIGHSFRITELEAALGLAQLDTWQEMIAARRLNATRLHLLLTALGDHLQLPAFREATGRAWMMFPIVLRDAPKDALCAYLEERGIETREM